MEKEEKAFFDLLKSEIRDFELPYEEGRWEEFKNMDENIRTVAVTNRPSVTKNIYFKMAAAAAVLLCLVLFLSEKQSVNRISQHTVSAVSENQGTHFPIAEKKEDVQVDGNSRQDEMKHNTGIPRPGFTAKSSAHESENIHDPVFLTTNTVASVGDGKMEAVITMDQSLTIYKSIINGKEKAISKMPGYILPVHSGSKNDRDAISQSKKWQFGLGVGSSFKEDKMNMEAGLVSQYHLSKVISLTGGLRYSEITANYQMDQPVQTTMNSRIVKQAADLKVMELPLALQYKPIDGWYASAGISFSTVLQENRITKVESDVVKERTSTDPQTGQTLTVLHTETMSTTQKSTATDFKGQGNLNYLNFAIGREQPLSRSTHLLIEPFIKLPTGAFAKKDIDLMQSGLRVKVVF